jgi:hypothetical protein
VGIDGHCESLQATDHLMFGKRRDREEVAARRFPSGKSATQR